MSRLLSIFIVAIFVLVAGTAYAQTPMGVIKTTIETAKQTKAQKKDRLSTEEIKKELESIIRPIFDFNEMSRRAIGKNWDEGSADQQQRYIDLFSKLLARTYMNKVTRGIEESEFIYSEERIEGDKAYVKTKILNKGDTIPTDYRMHKNGDKWLVYDVIIENIGLVSNYRSEFSGIVRNEGFNGLLVRLEEKMANEPK